MYVTPSLFNSNNFATSAALAEVCAVLSVVLVYLFIAKGGYAMFLTLRVSVSRVTQKVLMKCLGGDQWDAITNGDVRSDHDGVWKFFYTNITTAGEGSF